MRLKTRILLFVVPLVALPIIGVGWLGYDRLSENARNAAVTQVATLVDQTERQLESFLRTLHANLGLIADTRLLENYLLAPEEERYELLQLPLLMQLATYNRAFPEYYEIRILLEDGYEDLRYTGAALKNLTEEEGENPLFQAMHLQVEDEFVRLFRNPDNGRWALWASRRLMLRDASSIGSDAQEPSLRGYLVLTVDLALLQEQTATPVGLHGTLLFARSDGEILFHRDPRQIGQRLPEAVHKAALGGRFSLNLGKELFTGNRIGKDLLLITRIPNAELHQAGEQLRLQVLQIALVTTLISALMLLMVLRHLLILPIGRLATAAQQIGEGRLELELDPGRGDELGDLADAFNRMTSDLRESRAQEARAQAEALSNRELAIHNLEQADRLKDEFLANTSHELRTPLHGIIGLAESLIDGVAGPLNREARDNLIMIMASGRRLANLVNDILDFSRLKRAAIHLQLEPIDLHDLVQTVLNLSRPALGAKSLELFNRVDKDLPAALADPNRLQQILYNLIGNAIKFTRAGQVSISAQMETCEHPPQPGDLRNLEQDLDNQLVVSVQDTGIGIPGAALEQIFQSFEQGDGSAAREFGGTGLGLTITRQLLELHGCRIWVESVPGEGSTFHFTLPISLRDAPQRPLDTTRTLSDPLDDMEACELTQTSLLYDRTTNPFEILVVDDEPINLQVLENHLSQLNYQITRAESGLEALELIEQKGYRPDLILLDIMMPNMSGFETCQRLRERFTPSELPILMLTAKNQPQDIVEGFNSGANDYLTKPVAKSELLARVKTHIYLHSVNVALSRFVPHQFLELLQKENITDVKLGDQVTREMTVLFSDIRSFTSLSEQMSPRETYDFINKYLSRMEPEITAHQGFIDKYIGDAIMALFPTQAHEAVKCSVAMLQALQRFNREREMRGQPAICIGIGLNSGYLMLGTVGGCNRMDGTVISDTVNLASRIEGQTKLYGVPLLISEHTLERLPADHGHLIRRLDTVRVRGRQTPVTVYEVFDADPPALRSGKQETQAEFELAVRRFEEGDVDSAWQGFLAVLKRNPDDQAAHIYVRRCEQGPRRRETWDEL